MSFHANPEWVTLTRRTNDPKLKNLQYRLGLRGMVSKREGESFHTPILKVKAGDMEASRRVLEEAIDMGDGIHQRYDDIPDDDPMFKEITRE